MSISLRLDDRVRGFDLVILDCDGVLFDSNGLKTQAFREVLAPYPAEAVDAFIRHHQEWGGVSRYRKLSRFFTEVHPVTDPTAALAAALDGFGEWVRAGYDRLLPHEEAMCFVDRCSGMPVYVISGSDQEELRDVFRRKGLLDRFRDVLGSPTPKREHAERVLAAEGVDPGRVLFIGDGRSDAEVSASLGFHFAYLAEMSEWPDAGAALAGERSATVFPRWTLLMEAVR